MFLREHSILIIMTLLIAVAIIFFQGFFDNGPIVSKRLPCTVGNLSKKI